MAMVIWSEGILNARCVALDKQAPTLTWSPIIVPQQCGYIFNELSSHRQKKVGRCLDQVLFAKIGFKVNEL